MIASVPKNGLNKWVRLVTTNNQSVWFYVTDTRLVSNRILGGYIYIPDYSRADCASHQELIPAGYLRTWTRLYVKDGRSLLFYPTSKQYEDACQAIRGWVYTAEYDNIVCPVIDVEGDWDTTFGLMTLTQEGSVVQGIYGQNSMICGTLEGNVLTGDWTEGAITGTIRFEFSSDARTFTGFYGFGSETPDAAWDGVVVRDVVPPPSDSEPGIQY